jgi:hypothetical protein
MTQLLTDVPACDNAAQSPVRKSATTPRRLTQAEQRKLIRAALARDPTLPDLRIARAIGCAATTVARVREAAGVAPYLRHRDRCPPPAVQMTKRLLREQIATLQSELAAERTRRMNAEQALTALRASVPATRAAPAPRPPLAVPPVQSPPRDPAMGRPAQVPTYGRGLPAAIYCQECGDTRFWTGRDAQVWYCAGCYPPGHGQLTHKAGGWP